MWDYSNRWDSTQISQDELHEAEIDECVRAVTNIKKKSVVPKGFGTVAFSKAFPRTEVRFHLDRILFLYHSFADQNRMRLEFLLRSLR
jgi:hypothetical protein